MKRKYEHERLTWNFRFVYLSWGRSKEGDIGLAPNTVYTAM